MSNYIKNGVEYGDVVIIPEDAFPYLEGELLTTVELLGLPHQQEEALKSKVRQHIWGGFRFKFGKHTISAKEFYELLKSRGEVPKTDQSLTAPVADTE